jgi:hypothetical protein
MLFDRQRNEAAIPRGALAGGRDESRLFIRLLRAVEVAVGLGARR